MTNNSSPPVAAREPHKTTVHGNERVDNYHWLRSKDEQRVTDYLNAENAYTEQMTSHTEALQTKIYEEFLSHIKETDTSAWIKRGDNFYYSRTEEGKQYAISCRKLKALDNTEEILLDQNALAEGHSYFRLGAFAISPDQRLLAYSTDTEGDEIYTLVVKDLKSGELLPDRIENVAAGASWANDNQTIFYTTMDDTKRPYRLWRHKLGTNPEQDNLIYEESDETFGVGASATNSRRFLFVISGASQTTEYRYIDLDQPTLEPQLIAQRRAGVEYYVTHQGDRFLIRTNDAAKEFKVLEVPIGAPHDQAREFLPERSGTTIEGLEAFANHIAIFERTDGLMHLTIMDLSTKTSHGVDFPEPSYILASGLNPEYETSVLRLFYSSLVSPPTDFDYDMVAQHLLTVKQQEVPGYDPSGYTAERIKATARDGTQVPISVVRKKTTLKDGAAPIYVYGYGSYGASMDPGFNSRWLTLLDRGFVCAIAHIRGGGDLGEQWRESGKMLSKMNTFTDFIACAEHLAKEGFGSKDHIVMRGGSAGGLLMGAVVNLRPDLFKIVVAEVPFVDVVNTMLDATIPLTTHEYEEWGNPADREYYDYMMTYSPYDNVANVDYPDMLVTAGLNDPRVAYWEPAKWVAKLRATKTGDRVLLLKTNMDAGHGGASGRYDYLKEDAVKVAFILDRLGISS